MADYITDKNGNKHYYPVTLVMGDGREVTFDNSYDKDAMIKYRDTYNASIKEGTFDRPGESATEPEDVSTAGLNVGTAEGANMMLRNLAQIPTFGSADEIEAGLRAGGQTMGASFSTDQVGDYMTEKAYGQARQKAYENTGNTADVAQGVGSLFSPISAIPPAKSLSSELMRAFAGGASLDLGMSEDNYIMGALEGGTMASAMTLPGYLLFAGFSKLSQLKDRAKNIPKEIADQKTQMELAYKQANESGEVITNQEAQNILSKLKGEMTKRQRSDLSSSQGALEDLEGRLNDYRERNENMEWGDLDEIRQNLWSRWKDASKQNRGTDANNIVETIRSLDRYIDSVPDKGAQFKLARNLWKQQQQATIFDTLMGKARRATSVSGSGGNTANKKIDAIRKIRENDNLRQFFTEDQVKAMDAIINNFGSAKLSRAISKLDPSGNALMLFLQAYGAMAIDPTVLASAIAGNYYNRRINNMVDKDIDKFFYQDIMKKDPVVGDPTSIPRTMSIGQSAEGQPGEQGIMDMFGVDQGYNFAP